MRWRWLGWAGVEIEHDGDTVVIDAIEDTAAVFAPAGDAAATTPLPAVVAPQPRRALAALVTHLHRDHADAAAIRAALGDDGRLFGPAAVPGPEVADLALAQAQGELRGTGLTLEPAVPWQRFTAGPFHLTALPAVDGSGDPQVSWMVATDEGRLLHLGDTMFHGYWWRIVQTEGPIDVAFLPVNGAALNFPWRQPPSPLPAVMDPEQAVQAARALGCAQAVPIHFGAYELEPVYRPAPDALERFLAGASAAAVATRTPGLGEWVEVRVPHTVG